MNKQETVNIILEGLGASNLISLFNENGIDINKLSLLSDADLLALGIEDRNLRANILKQNNKNHIETSPYNCIDKNFTSNVINNSSRHLNKLQSSLLTNYINFKRNPNLIDSLVSDNMYSSQALVIGLNCLLNNVKKAENELNILSNNIINYKP